MYPCYVLSVEITSLVIITSHIIMLWILLFLRTSDLIMWYARGRTWYHMVYFLHFQIASYLSFASSALYVKHMQTVGAEYLPWNPLPFLLSLFSCTNKSFTFSLFFSIESCCMVSPPRISLWWAESNPCLSLYLVFLTIVIELRTTHNSFLGGLLSFVDQTKCS